MIHFRPLKFVIEERLQEKDPLIQVILGPRQVGKTTAIQQALNGRGLYETADSPLPLNTDQLEQWWDKASQQKPYILAIDEVQKILGWSEIIKKLWDQSRTGKRPPIKVLLSGSAALALEKNLRESLAGRYEIIRADHWGYAEANKVFGVTLKQFIEFGCYPGSMTFLNDPIRWSAYIRDSIIEPAIGRDILQLHPVQHPALLRQLFGIATSLPSQVVSLNKLQGQLQDRGAISTIQHYLDLLGHGFLVSGVQKYSEAKLRTKRSSPKLVVHDNALLRAFLRPADATLNPEQFGRYFENAICARFIEAGWDTNYWIDRQLEVDLVVQGPDGRKLAIEVKSSSVSATELKGLKEFCKRHQDFEPCLISFIHQKVEGVLNWEPEDVLSLSSL